MFPIALDLTHTKVLLAGHGELLSRRLKQLQDAKATQVTVLDGALPTREQVAAHAVIMATGLSREQSQQIAAVARAAGKLVNVEDVNELCDFYFTANLRRGELVIAVSTGGASPTLARKVRDWLAARFGEEWGARVEEIKNLRLRWKAEGKDMKEVLEGTEKHVKDNHWLDEEAA